MKDKNIDTSGSWVRSLQISKNRVKYWSCCAEDRSLACVLMGKRQTLCCCCILQTVWPPPRTTIFQRICPGHTAIDTVAIQYSSSLTHYSAFSSFPVGFFFAVLPYQKVVVVISTWKTRNIKERCKRNDHKIGWLFL